MASQSDKRLSKSTAAEVRGSRGAADVDRTEVDGTALTSEERRAMIRNEFQHEALPRAPHIPGYHCVWLSTTNSYDPITKRQRMGYIPVKQEEVPGYIVDKVLGGQHEGFISCNEMLLFKIDQEMYLSIMEEFHHHMPQEEEEQLKNSLVKEETDRSGKPLTQIEDGGFADIAVKGKTPSFAL